MTTQRQRHIAILGMSGVGKSEASRIFMSIGYSVVAFGQIIRDEVEMRGLPAGQESERAVRNDLRNAHGPAALALLAADRLSELCQTRGNVLIDGAYTPEECTVLRTACPGLVTVAIHAPMAVRISRLEHRLARPQTEQQTRERDRTELNETRRADAIVMADHHVVNDADLGALRRRLLDAVFPEPCGP